ncbi:hypothetical protein [Aliikangiella coralliicola]|uniref:DUF2127 domain-containing protein n=1 Tax=Aliikangiella coralliicola TaxID=2592383 RepID=A0A545TST6_9GAMM|nr:hypothetical protein [Aliikangiella coralliicola]TQV80272.1 hypothetical protein FLL46_26510 [Aliikangiella coralliicola]
MIRKISRYYSYLLILGAIGMTAWGLAGFIEYLFGATVIIPLQNPNFPPGTQFIHWLLISLSGAIFLFGYFKRWKYTPNVKVVIYACLATMCFIQTFDFMTREDRYISYVVEVTNYIVVSIYLFKSKLMQEHFRRN